jgi:hypothetical protein
VIGNEHRLAVSSSDNTGTWGRDARAQAGTTKVLDSTNLKGRKTVVPTAFSLLCLIFQSARKRRAARKPRC